MYEGGYYLIQDNLIRSGIHKHTLSLADPISDATLDAVNAVQATPWRINTWILDLMRECWLNGDLVGGLPSSEDRPLPPRYPDDVWAAMSREDRREHKRLLSEIHGENARAQSERQAFLEKLSVAEELRDVPSIYYPHFLDFRHRMYPLATQGPNPQGDGVARGLLMFAEGRELGPRGLYWLAVRLANTFGLDKLGLDERVDWVLANTQEIEDSGLFPLDGARLWCEAEDPWSFLATAREYAMAMQRSDPNTFVSHLPVALDGSCNGLQHLSALGRDPTGARATNLAADIVRHDIYEEVASVVSRLVTEDAVRGVPEAQAWVGNVSRKTVKRAVMTTPYGVTDRGIRDQLIADGHVSKDIATARGAAADYLRDKIVQALSQTVLSAREIMAWLQDCARLMAAAGCPMEWTTPAGSRVRQNYCRLQVSRVQTLSGRLSLWEEDPLGTIDPKKQALASAPNVIHSFDAAHLALTVNEMVARGVRNFSMVHDSYATHAADTDLMAQTLRETFVSIYRTDWLSRLYSDFRTSASHIDLPPPPAQGEFEVSEVLRSQFFFS